MLTLLMPCQEGYGDAPVESPTLGALDLVLRVPHLGWLQFVIVPKVFQNRCPRVGNFSHFSLRQRYTQMLKAQTVQPSVIRLVMYHYHAGQKTS